MANIKSSEKANRQRITRTARNIAQTTAMRSAIKKLRAAIGGKNVKDLINDQVWNADVFLPTVGKRGAARGEIASAVGINPYFLDDILVPAKRMTRSALAGAFDRLFQADVDLKSSKLDPDVALARLVQTLAESSAR